MIRPVFGRDRDPLASADWRQDTRPECAPDGHLVDHNIDICARCGWQDPEVIRCQTQGCVRPAEYRAEVAAAADPTFSSPLVSASFCPGHAFMGGVALIPTGPTA